MQAGTHDQAEVSQERLFTGISIIVGLLGIGLGWMLFSKRPLMKMPRLLENKYYVDEVYDRRFVDVAKAFAGAAWAFDIHIIDGLVNRLGWAIKLGGGGLRRAQTGVVGNYALSVVAGLLLIMVVYGGYATGWLRR